MMIKKPFRLLFLSSVLALLVINPLKAQESMRINLSGGTSMEIAIADIQKLTFDLTTAIEQHPEIVKQLLKLKVYPNPAKDQVVIDYCVEEKGQVVIEIFNINGLQLQTINPGFLHPGNYSHKMNLRHLSAGTYVCRIHQNNQFVTKKIIVKH
jgi:hypothetical protein